MLREASSLHLPLPAAGPGVSTFFKFLFQEGIHPFRVHLWQRFAFVICLAALADILHFDFGVFQAFFQFPNARFHGLMPFLQHAVTFAQCRITLANQVKKRLISLSSNPECLRQTSPRSSSISLRWKTRHPAPFLGMSRIPSSSKNADWTA